MERPVHVTRNCRPRRLMRSLFGCNYGSAISRLRASVLAQSQPNARKQKGVPWDGPKLSRTLFNWLKKRAAPDNGTS